MLTVIFALDQTVPGQCLSSFQNCTELLVALTALCSAHHNQSVFPAVVCTVLVVMICQCAFIAFLETPAERISWALYSSLIMHYPTFVAVIFAACVNTVLGGEGTRMSISMSLGLVVLWTLHLLYEHLTIRLKTCRQNFAVITYGLQVLSGTHLIVS